MLTILFFLFIKKIWKQHTDLAHAYLLAMIMRRLACLLLILLLSGIFINAKCQQLNYRIIRSGSDIGWVKVEKNCNENRCRIKLNSEIKFRLLLSISATVAESSDFINGKLIFSSQYHRTNGNVKVNKQIRFKDNCYEVAENNETERLAFDHINFNLICLYFYEPKTLKKVYCDKLERFADILRTADGGYKVTFPNGDSNCYYYTDGVCTRVKIEHTFYSANIILSSKN